MKKFIDDTSPSVRFCFTDDLVRMKTLGSYGAIPWHWFPWVPGKDIPIENVFAFISTFKNLDEVTGLNKSFWLHCDSSSMRAPTYFGLALHALFPNEMMSLCKEMATSENSWEFAHESRADKYAKISLERDPGVKELIAAWQSGGEAAAYEYYMRDK